jgi:hypothetical protein
MAARADAAASGENGYRLSKAWLSANDEGGGHHLW